MNQMKSAVSGAVPICSFPTGVGLFKGDQATSLPVSYLSIWFTVNSYVNHSVQVRWSTCALEELKQLPESTV